MTRGLVLGMVLSFLCSAVPGLAQDTREPDVRQAQEVEIRRARERSAARRREAVAPRQGERLRRDQIVADAPPLTRIEGRIAGRLNTRLTTRLQGTIDNGRSRIDVSRERTDDRNRRR